MVFVSNLLEKKLVRSKTAYQHFEQRQTYFNNCKLAELDGSDKESGGGT